MYSEMNLSNLEGVGTKICAIPLTMSNKRMLKLLQIGKKD
jgi:hypothetical protein